MRDAKAIALRNDRFRKTMISDSRHRTVLTASVAESQSRDKIIEAVRNFDEFTGGNDPHGEHDFGRVNVDGDSYYFKLDYYDLNYEYGADPDEEEYALLLTIMHTSDY